jgi:hypothetical protein
VDQDQRGKDESEHGLVGSEKGGNSRAEDRSLEH